MMNETHRTPATTAAAYRHNIGQDFTMSDALDSDYLDTDEVEDVDVMTTEQRQALNLALASWWEV